MLTPKINYTLLAPTAADVFPTKEPTEGIPIKEYTNAIAAIVKPCYVNYSHVYLSLNFLVSSVVDRKMHILKVTKRPSPSTDKIIRFNICQSTWSNCQRSCELRLRQSYWSLIIIRNLYVYRKNWKMKNHWDMIGYRELELKAFEHVPLTQWKYIRNIKQCVK